MLPPGAATAARRVCRQRVDPCLPPPPPYAATPPVAALPRYKTSISPLLAPACRFYPTCSSYAIASIKEYGALQGLILTAWRLLRCNPFGGKGYDQPTWPPPGWFAGGAFPDRPPNWDPDNESTWQ